MAENLVSQPPLNQSLVDASGRPSKAWAIWFRDLYRRTSYQGGNAIDDNKNSTDEEIVDINSTLQQTIVALNAHIEADQAHGSNGDIIGRADTATELLNGLVKQMALVADAVQSNVSVTSPNVSTAPAAYNQAHINTIVSLSNELKSDVNQLVQDLNNSIDVLNNLLSNSKTSGQMNE